MGNFKFSPFIISVAAVLAVSVGICIASCASSKINFSSTYYFVYYSECDNVVSAGSFSVAVADFGGAGYILEYDGKLYVTVACYYSENDAKAVIQSLKRQEIDCKILSVETESYKLSNSEKGNLKLYSGNLNTLNSLSSLAYECANGLDTGKYGQAEAKKILADIQKGLSGLLNANKNNRFTDELHRLEDICKDMDGYLYSKNLRSLQIAVADTVINIKL